MIRGTTAQFRFKIPYMKSELAWANIKFWQNNNPNKLLPIKKTLENCGNPDESMELCVSLTAEETARFSDKYKAVVQLRALHIPSGTVFGTTPTQVPVYPMSDDMLGEDDIILPEENDEGFIVLDGDIIRDNMY